MLKNNTLRWIRMNNKLMKLKLFKLSLNICLSPLRLCPTKGALRGMHWFNNRTLTMRACFKVWWCRVWCCQRATLLVRASEVNPIPNRIPRRNDSGAWLVRRTLKIASPRLRSILLFLARWRHHAQVCQCPGSKRVNFRSAPFAFLFRTELEISESACAAIPKYACRF